MSTTYAKGDDSTAKWYTTLGAGRNRKTPTSELGLSLSYSVQGIKLIANEPLTIHTENKSGASNAQIHKKHFLRA